MSKSKLEIEIFSAWNTYAISMMSVLENCGMWSKTDTFQKFMCETGIAVKLSWIKPVVLCLLPIMIG